MKRSIMALLAGVALLAAAATASATSYTLTYGDAYYVGYVFDGVPSGLGPDTQYVTQLLTYDPGETGSFTFTDPGMGTETFSRVASTLTGLPGLAGLTGYFDDTITAGPTFDVDSIVYVLAKYDGPNAGLLVWNLSALNPTDTVTLMSQWGPATKEYGISNYATWEAAPVPEPGTIVLLGAGLLGLAIYGKRRQNKA